ncbi:hypothetical protein GCM10023340_21860 [Nocardioides marinquilinus]|uniref:Uncharacterized protein n=1 Tax=Nocardioides marinquilinus TaxID=1210400 RepID=A0ABP9PSA2_9ACTN
MSPWPIYRDLLAGDPGQVRALADDADDRSRAVDADARAIVDAASRPLADWEGGEARRRFEARGLEAYLNAAIASFRLHRGSVVLRWVAGELDDAREWAGEVVRDWERAGRPTTGPRADHAVREVQRAKDAYGRALHDAVRQLRRVDAEVERWMGEGAVLDYVGYLRNDALPGPRVADSRLNGARGGWIQQGLGYDPASNQYLISSYQPRDGATDGARLTAVDATTGAPGPSVPLGGVGRGADGLVHSNEPGAHRQPNHVGGVAVQGDRVLVTSTEEAGSFVYVYDRSALAAYQAGGPPVAALDKIAAPASSYAGVGADGSLYLGRTSRFEPGEEPAGEKHGVLYQVRYDESTGALTTQQAWDTPAGVNGVAVEDGGVFTFAVQGGRGERGDLVTVDSGGDGKVQAADLEAAEHTRVGNMVQNLALVNGSVVSVSESGAEKYLRPLGPGQAPFLWRQTHLTELVNGGEGYAVVPRTLDQAAGELALAEAGLDDEHARIRSLDLAPGTLGDVPGRTPLAEATTAYFDRVARRLNRSLDAVRVSVDGLRAATVLYRGSDEDAARSAQRLVDRMV